MKKNAILVLVMLVLSIMSLSIVACKSATVDKFSKSAGTTVYVEGINKDTLFGDWRFRVGYSKGDDKIVKTTEQGLELVHDIDVNVPAKYTVKVKFNGFELSVDVRIVTKDTLLDEITGYEDNDNIKAYVSHRDYVSSGDLGSEQSEFVKTGESYFVGNLNAWSYNPAVLAKKQDGTFYTPIDFISDVKVEKKQGGNYTTLNQEDDYANFTTTVDSFGTVNLTTGEFLINQGISGEYRITRTPTSITYPNIDQIKNNKTTLSITIIDGGYNATTALDLNQIDNSHMPHILNQDGTIPHGVNYRPHWEDFRTLKGLVFTDPKAVIFHDDITLTHSEIPSDFVDQNGFLDIDYEIFTHNMKGVDDSFEIIGNYFNLDASGIKLVNMPSYQVLPDTSLFGFLGRKEGDTVYKTGKTLTRYLDHQKGAKVNIRNLSAKGNAKRSSDTSLKGGVRFIQQYGQFVELDIDNIISTDWNTTTHWQGWGSKRVLQNSKIFDNYNFAMYLLDAGDDNYIINSELRNSGGPLIYSVGEGNIKSGQDGWVDAYSGEPIKYIDSQGNEQTSNPDGSLIANKSLLNVDDKTIFDNFTDGLSPWFTGIGAIESSMLSNIIKLIKAFSKELTTVSTSNGDTKNIVETKNGAEIFNLVNITFLTVELGPIIDSNTLDYDKVPFNGGLKIFKDGSLYQNGDMGATAIHKDTIQANNRPINQSSNIINTKLKPNTVISNFDTMVGATSRAGDLIARGLGDTPSDIAMGYLQDEGSTGVYGYDLYSCLDPNFTPTTKSQQDQLFGGEYINIFAPKSGKINLLFRWANV